MAELELHPERLPPADDSPLAAAQRYVRRGWRPIVVPARSKNPGRTRWEQERLELDELHLHFNGRAQNIGILLGEPSGWLIDVDLDHPLAVERATEFLPPTPLRFGRESKPESHWIYRVTASLATKKHRSKSAGMIVELRSTGMQTVFPPSIHESGEAIEFVDPSAEPAEVDPTELHDAVKRLSDAVLIELGEKTAPRTPVKRTRTPCVNDAPPAEKTPLKSCERAARAMAAILRMQTLDRRDGSLRLFSAACRCVEYDLSDADALALLREYIRLRPFPREWADVEILQRLADARKKVIPGAAFQPARESDGLTALGSRDPETGRIVLSPSRTLPTAQAYVSENHQSVDGRTLHSHGGVLMEWDGVRYVELEECGAHSRLLPWLHEAVRYVLDRQTKEMRLVPFEANPHSMRAALESIKASVHLPASVECPSWLDGRSGPPPNEVLVTRSSLIHLPSGRRLDPTPQLFVTNALDFDLEPAAPEPKEWLRFLGQLFGVDTASVELLQDWFGYSLTADTSQQKMLLMVGPTRSGKGTIARVLGQLAGKGNVCGPMTSALAGPFGLQPLIGKSLAIVSDARFVGENIATVVERLLAISGEDEVTIDRKYETSVTMKLPTRFVFLTNELPKLTDASGALAGRFVILRFFESFYGREDIGLTKRLLKELPGILNWAVAGWKRLHDRGHFVMPRHCQEAMTDLEELTSPTIAFVRERCLLDPAARIWCDELYHAWSHWCFVNGRTVVPPNQVFGKDLLAAYPKLKARRGTDNRRFYEGIGLRRNAP